MSVKLRKVTLRNLDAIIRTWVKPEQRNYIGSTSDSSAEASLRDNLIANAIYNDDEVVGFVLHGTWDERPMIFRILINQHKQQKGYGTEAIKLLTDLYKKHL